MRQVRVPPYGTVWSVGPEPATLKLAEQVDAYFELGVTVPAGGVVVDVGANIGMFALAAAARVPDVRFVSVEPVPEIFEALSANFRRHPLLKDRGRLAQAAVVSDAAETEVRLSYFAHFPSDTTRYLDAKHHAVEQVFAHEGRRAGDRVEHCFDGRAGRALAAVVECAVAGLPRGRLGRWAIDRAMGRREVDAAGTTLSALLTEEGPVDLLKIDVEGAELDVLTSLDEQAWPKVRRVVLESNDEIGHERLGAMLRERGLTEQRIHVPQRARFGAVGDFLLDASRAA